MFNLNSIVCKAICACALVFVSKHSFAQASCASSYGTTCPSCAGKKGRSYTAVEPFGCSVCWDFCKINIPRPASAGSDVSPVKAEPLEQEASSAIFFPYEERLFLKVKGSLVTSLALTSPDIAQAAKSITELSENIDTPMTSHGHIVSSKLATPASVAASVGGNGLPVVAMLLRDIQAADTISMVTWELRKASRANGRAQLIFRHRLLHEPSKATESIQPDIAFDLVWRRARIGGFWEALAWQKTGEL